MAKAEYADGLDNDVATITVLQHCDDSVDHLMEHEVESDEDLEWCPFRPGSHPIVFDDRDRD